MVIMELSCNWNLRWEKNLTGWEPWECKLRMYAVLGEKFEYFGLQSFSVDTVLCTVLYFGWLEGSLITWLVTLVRV